MAKITLKDGTVIEGTAEEIAELAERFDEEEVVEDGKESELKTVNRAAKVGERVLITGAYMTDGKYDNGDILTVIKADGIVCGGVDVDAYGRVAYVTIDEYEVIVEESDEIKEGDTVELLSTDEPTLQGFNAGDVCTVTEVYESIMRGTRLEIYNADNRVGYCSPEKVVKVDVKIEVGDEVILDAGDDEDSYPLNGFYNGVEYKVTDMNPDHEKEGVIEIGDNSRGNPGYPTLDQVKLLRKAEDIEEETAKEFNVGDYAKVIGETYHDDISAGTIVKIYREKDEDGDYRVDLIDGSDHDYAQADSLEHYEPSERELAFLRVGREVDEIKVGDIAEVEFSPNAHSVGALVRVIGTHDGNGVYAKGMELDKLLEYSYRTHNLKLVAKAENRVDVDA